MAPLTRNRATHGSDVPSELAATYYRQRASAGLIVSEGYADQPTGSGLRLDARDLHEAQVGGCRRRPTRCMQRVAASSPSSGTSAAFRTFRCSRMAARRSRLRRSAPTPAPSSRAASPKSPSRAGSRRLGHFGEAALDEGARSWRGSPRARPARRRSAAGKCAKCGRRARAGRRCARPPRAPRRSPCASPRPGPAL